ncbi:hypothetical protein [Gluconobacter oxydans]|uniref:hypothetical protein n=1 Tax=Gluconobacter oxydans TaxID=442 RepID=UPI00155984D7|nr:hypothetical protein [Gluconobacter oxydans]
MTSDINIVSRLRIQRVGKERFSFEVWQMHPSADGKPLGVSILNKKPNLEECLIWLRSWQENCIENQGKLEGSNDPLAKCAIETHDIPVRVQEGYLANIDIEARKSSETSPEYVWSVTLTNSNGKCYGLERVTEDSAFKWVEEQVDNLISS